jgi:hypothetical protein
MYLNGPMLGWGICKDKKGQGLDVLAHPPQEALNLKVPRRES